MNRTPHRIGRWTLLGVISLGFLISASLIVSPVFCLAWFGDSLSKDPIGPTLHRIGAAVGLVFSLVSLVLAFLALEYKYQSFAMRSWDRIGEWLAFAFGISVLLSILLAAGYPCIWDDWAYRAARAIDAP